MPTLRKRAPKRPAFAAGIAQERLELRLLLASDLFFSPATSIQLAADEEAAIDTRVYYQTLADLNNDGRDDVVAIVGQFLGDDEPARVVVGLSNGDGTFEMRINELGMFPIDQDTDRLKVAVAVAEVDLPESNETLVFSDMVVAIGTNVLLLNNQGNDQDGWLGFADPVSLRNLATDSVAVEVADVNADGRPDVISLEQDKLSVHLSDGAGTFSDGAAYSVRNYQLGHDYTIDVRGDMVVGDFNHDGTADLIMTRSTLYQSNDGETSIYLGNEDGTFRDPVSVSSQGSPSIVMEDLNRDGNLDVATLSEDQVIVHSGIGDGTFKSTEYEAVGRPVSIVAEDIDDDGIVDLVIGNRGVCHGPFLWSGCGSRISEGTSFLMGNADGTFSAPRRVVGGGEWTSVGDVNADGIIDLATSNEMGYEGRVHVMRGVIATPTLEYHSSVAVENDAYQFQTADVDGDGHADVSLVEYGSGVSLVRGNGDGTFVEPERLPTGSRPKTTFAGDFNSDSFGDLAVVNYSDVSLLLGREDGGFDSEARYPVGQFPADHVQLDIDGDGLIDLAVANQDSDDISLLLATRSDGFIERSRLLAGSGPVAIKAADLNGDDQLDLIVANRDSDDVSIILAKGNGQFEEQIRYHASSEDPSTMAVIDADGDGDLDLAIGHNYSSQIAVLENAGDGTFLANRSTGLSLALDSSTADFNSDGHVDLVVTTRRRVFGAREVVSEGVFLMFGDGSGGFHDSDYSYPINSTANRMYPKVADINGDGHPDVIFVDGTELVVLWGSDVGLAEDPWMYQVPPASDVAVLDLNGDENVDIVVGTAGEEDGSATHPLTVMYGMGDGEFGESTRLPGPGMRLSDAVVADFNNDGTDDLAGFGVCDGSRCSTKLGVLMGGPIDQLASPTFFSDTGTRLHTGDTNGDGHLDLVYSAGANLYVKHGNGDGTFGSFDFTWAEVWLDSMSVFDFNEDSIDDVFTLTADGKAHVYLGQQQDSLGEKQEVDWHYPRSQVSLADADSDGRSDLLVSLSNSLVVVPTNRDLSLANPRRQSIGNASLNDLMIAADVNNDGLDDLVASTRGHVNDIQVLTAQGNGEFTVLDPISTNGLGPSFVVADLNADGNLDVAFSNGGTLEIRHGNGSGDFTSGPKVRISERRFGAEMILSDVNQDGYADFVVANWNDRIAVIQSTADGGLREPVEYIAGASISSISTVDETGDGYPEIIVTNSESNDIAMLINRGDGTFDGPPRIPILANENVVSADFNSDGVPDFAGSSENQVWVTTLQANGTVANQTTFDRPNVREAIHGDVNNDGQLDLVVITSQSTTEGSGVHSFLDASDPESPMASTELPQLFHVNAELADFNSDDKLDLVISYLGDNGLQVLLGNGDGTFDEGDTILGFQGEIKVVDINGDSNVDLLEFHPYPSDLPSYRAWHGLGDGTFDRGAADFSFSSSYYGYAIDTHDLDNDGDQDLVLSSGAGFDVVLNSTVQTPLRGDFDANGELTKHDIDLLFGAIRSGETSARTTFDLTNDGELDDKDADTWIREILQTSRGDANLDGAVDFADFLALSAAFGKRSDASWAEGDFNGDESVDFADFLFLTENFG